MVRLFENAVSAVGQAAAYALLPLALLQVAILVARRFGHTAVAAGEIATWIAVPVGLLTIPWVLQLNAHVAADALAERFPPAVRRVVETLALLLALAFALALMWLSAPYAWGAFVTGEGSLAMSGLGFRWVPKAIVPLFALLLALQAVASLVRR